VVVKHLYELRRAEHDVILTRGSFVNIATCLIRSYWITATQTSTLERSLCRQNCRSACIASRYCAPSYNIRASKKIVEALVPSARHPYDNRVITCQPYDNECNISIKRTCIDMKLDSYERSSIKLP